MIKDHKIQQALKEAVSVIYFADNSDYATALWEIVLILGGNDAVELLDSSPRQAYEKYCSQL